MTLRLLAGLLPEQLVVGVRREVVESQRVDLGLECLDARHVRCRGQLQRDAEMLAFAQLLRLPAVTLMRRRLLPTGEAETPENGDAPTDESAEASA